MNKFKGLLIVVCIVSIIFNFFIYYFKQIQIDEINEKYNKTGKSYVQQDRNENKELRYGHNVINKFDVNGVYQILTKDHMQNANTGDGGSPIVLKNDLKVIYDAAHCFGVEYNNESVFNLNY